MKYLSHQTFAFLPYPVKSCENNNNKKKERDYLAILAFPLNSQHTEVIGSPLAFTSVSVNKIVKENPDF